MFQGTSAGGFIDDIHAVSGWFAKGEADLPRRDTGCVPSQNCNDSNWPMMVRFRDINDPRTVERVEPEAIGVKRITVETTRDAVTTGIEKRLGWLETQEGSLVKRPAGAFPLDPPLGWRLTELDFYRGTNLGK